MNISDVNLKSLNASVQSALGIEPLILSLNSDWSSGTENFRVAIRQAIFQLKPESSKLILDLATVPASEFVSIAHCPALGGFAMLQTDSDSSVDKSVELSIGFDLELENRAHLTVVKRVSTAVELESAPAAPALWCAKEAVFKSLLGRNQPKTISEIEISDWRRPSAESSQDLSLNAFRAAHRSGRQYSGLGCVFCLQNPLNPVWGALFLSYGST